MSQIVGHVRDTRRSFWLLSANLAFVLTAIGQPAQAQGTDRLNPETVPGDIIVTATRTSERLSRVPASVTAFTQESLDVQGIRNIQDLSRASPSLTYQPGSNGQSTISIRGIRSTVGAGTTGIYIDDTPIQVRSMLYSSGTAFPPLFDLERVEVLRGPQGTLFGAGSMGGTVRFISPKVNLNGFSGSFRAEFSATEKGDPGYEVGAALSGPIVEDRVGLRVSGLYRRTGGYIDRVDFLTSETIDKNSDWQEDKSFRMAFLARLGNIEVEPTAYFQDLRANAIPYIWPALSKLGSGVYRSGYLIDQPSTDRMFLPALRIGVDLGAVRITSNTSYVHRKKDVDIDYTRNFTTVFARAIHLPSMPYYTILAEMENKQKSFFQEVRVESNDPSARLQWVIGGFYARERQTANITVTDPNFPAFILAATGATIEQVLGANLIDNTYSLIQDISARDEQLAFFGEVRYNLTDQLKVILGMRWAHTKFNFEAVDRGPVVGLGGVYTGKQSENPFTPKFGITYQATPDTMFYATAAKGFRIGGANPPPPMPICAADLAALSNPDLRTYASDKVWSYEAGAKSAISRGVQVEGSVFYIDWKDIQQPLPLGCRVSPTTNIGSAVSKGFDLQLRLQPLDGLSLTGAVAYTSAKFNETARTPTAVLVNDGDPLAIPPWTVTVSAEQSFLALGGEAFARGDLRYQSSYHGTPPAGTVLYQAADYRRPGVTEASVRVGVNWDKFGMSLFVNNLFNSTDLTARVLKGPAIEAAILRPRTMGITLTSRF